MLLNVVVLFVKPNCTTCVSVLVKRLVSKSVLSKNALQHPKACRKQRGWRFASPFFISDGAGKIGGRDCCDGDRYKNPPKQVQSQSCCCWFPDGVGGAGSTVPGFTMNLDSVSKSDKCTSAIYVLSTGDNVLSFRC
ncbi:hypothetical protein KCP75_14250 [Salmonella enterica subsp. enterica]|nr:hypothetical protein KCP75_14250 [Salmonella enterica subsp. enterica]